MWVNLEVRESSWSLVLPRKSWQTLHDQNLRYTKNIADCSRNQQRIETGYNQTQLLISLLLMPWAYKLNEIVKKIHKIIAIITKIQIKHKHNNKPIKHRRFTLHATCDTIVLFIVRVKILKFFFNYVSRW